MAAVLLAEIWLRQRRRELDYNLIFLRLLSGRDPESGDTWVWLDPGFAGAPLRFAVQAFMATLVMLGALMFAHSLSSAAIAAGLASSVVAIFMNPSNRNVRIRSVVGGHTVALVLGSAMAGLLFFGPVETFLTDIDHLRNFSYAVAVGLAVLLMAITNTEHPPAAGTAIGMATREFDILIFLSIIGAVVMLAIIKLALRPHLRDLT